MLAKNLLHVYIPLTILIIFLYKLYLQAIYLHVGVNQTLGGYYKRMRDYFNDHKREGCVHSQIAIQHRWSLIQKAMNKLIG
jgi:hypothetical protein